MASPILLALCTIIGLYALKLYLQFARNLKAAKESGIPYTIVPFFLVNRLYQISSIILIPVMRKFPKSWTEPWYDLTLEWGWHRRYEPFKRFGSDTFITVSPERNVLFTADADVIVQMTTRRNDFPKPLEVYGSIQLFGDNVVTVEGQQWRHHRKITSPPFTEKNNHLVWVETLDQCQAMINSWLGGQSDTARTIRTIADDAMRLSLHVISRAGFGVRLQWPGTEKPQTKGSMKEDSEDPVSSSEFKGHHTMSYTEALSTVLHNIIAILVTPSFLLKNLPFQTTKRIYTSYVEWGDYMNEMFQKKKAAVLSRTEGDQLDLMIALIKGAGITPENFQKGDKAARQSLTDQEILGNAFIFLLAGHETTANSIHFNLALLAMNLASQRRLQSDLDEIFQGRPVNQSSYDEVVPKLFGSMAGAVMNEELRLFAPVVGLPKCTPRDNPQSLDINGKKVIVPAGIYIQLSTTGVHRNPKYWPTGPPSDPQNPAHPLSNLDNDLEEFKPERWLLDGESKAIANAKTSDQDGDPEAASLGVNTAADTSAALFRPPKGAYIPFSEGHRSCLGRRFAQVEILAVLALIFTQFSVELAVDKYSSDEEVEGMDDQQKKSVWKKAKQEVERQMREDMGSSITLQLRKGAIGLRLVRRGKERFDGL